MSWLRAPVAQALVAMGENFGVDGYVHERPREIVNPRAVVIGRTTAERYGAAGLGVDEVDLTWFAVGGVEDDDDVDALADQMRKTIDADPTLLHTVQVAWLTEARGWRNVTGAGGIQLLFKELSITVHM